jgi:hypothetical protein
MNISQRNTLQVYSNKSEAMSEFVWCLCLSNIGKIPKFGFG